jgi:hypothetical protein
MMNFKLAFAMGGLLLALGTAVAVAGVELNPAVIEQALEPSQVPSLLGAIPVEGRVGWACEPEKAAMTVSIHDAHLPQPTIEK